MLENHHIEKLENKLHSPFCRGDSTAVFGTSDAAKGLGIYYVGHEELFLFVSLMLIHLCEPLLFISFPVIVAVLFSSFHM